MGGSEFLIPLVAALVSLFAPRVLGGSRESQHGPTLAEAPAMRCEPRGEKAHLTTPPEHRQEQLAEMKAEGGGDIEVQVRGGRCGSATGTAPGGSGNASPDGVVQQQQSQQPLYGLRKGDWVQQTPPGFTCRV